MAIQHLNQMIQEYDKTPSKELFIAICYCGRMLGILYNLPTKWFQSDKNRDIDESYINMKIKERTQAKQDKNFTLSDKIRNELFDLGIILEDSADGTNWRKDDSIC
jgi:cysteinyl-tRNA synthetase